MSALRHARHHPERLLEPVSLSRLAGVAERLDDEDLGVRELAAIALGDSRRANALDVLLGRMGRLVRASDRAPYFTALALHRSEPALRALLAFLEGPRPTAIAALEALAVRRFEPDVVERVEGAARAAGLADAFAEAFDTQT